MYVNNKKNVNSTILKKRKLLNDNNDLNYKKEHFTFDEGPKTDDKYNENGCRRIKVNVKM